MTLTPFSVVIFQPPKRDYVITVTPFIVVIYQPPKRDCVWLLPLQNKTACMWIQHPPPYVKDLKKNLINNVNHPMC